MSSDQQKMYNHASNVVRLLSSDLPEEAVIKQIGDIVREAVEIARGATINNVLMHVPAILLSASAEFDRAYRTHDSSTPRLSQISENDQRAKASSWYQPLVYTRHYNICNVPRVFFAKQALGYPSFACDQCRNMREGRRKSSALPCDAQPLRNDVPPSHMAAQVQEVVALLKEHRLTPLPSRIESR